MMRRVWAGRQTSDLQNLLHAAYLPTSYTPTCLHPPFSISQVRHDQTKAQAQAIGLPQFRPAWLKRLGGAEPPIEGASAADTTGKAW